MPILEPITTSSSTDSESINRHIDSRENGYTTRHRGEASAPATEQMLPIELEKQSTANSTSSRLNQRAQSVVSRIRSREPGQVAKFTHPLSHTKTGSDVLVDFEGPDDPYYPKNWGFQKKCITTVLYGLTTAGA